MKLTHVLITHAVLGLYLQTRVMNLVSTRAKIKEKHLLNVSCDAKYTCIYPAL